MPGLSSLLNKYDRSPASMVLPTVHVAGRNNPDAYQKHYLTVKKNIIYSSLLLDQSLGKEYNKKFNTPENKLQWIITNIDAINYLDDDKFSDNIKDEEYQTLRKDTAEIRSIINEWMNALLTYEPIPQGGSLVHKRRLLLEPKDYLHDPSSIKPGTPEAEAWDKLQKADKKINDYFLYTIHEIKANKYKTTAIEEDKAAIAGFKSMNDMALIAEGFDPIAALKTVQIIAEKHPKETDLIADCETVLEKLRSLGETNKDFDNYIKNDRGSSVIEKIEDAAEIARIKKYIQMHDTDLNKDFDPVAAIKGIKAISEKYPERHVLVIDCMSAAKRINSLCSENKKFQQLVNTDEIKSIVKELTDKGKTASSEYADITNKNYRLKYGSPKDDTYFIENIKKGTGKELPDVKKVDDIYRLQLINAIANRNHNDPKLQADCGLALGTIAKHFMTDEKLHDYAHNGEGSKLIKNIKKIVDLAERRLDYNEKILDFSKKLKEASIHDSKEYKELMTLVSAFNDKKPDPFFDDLGNRREIYAGLDDAQFAALPYIMIHNKINQYLEHKAKDGVNRNSYRKLAAIEELNQYVCKKIKGIDPEDFELKLEGKGKTTTLSFDPRDVYETYEDELEAARNALWNDSLSKEDKLSHINNPENTIINDTSIPQYTLKDLTGLSGKNLEALVNASSCMDRIMLKKQTEKKSLEEDIKTLIDGGVPEHKGSEKLYNMRKAFFKDPIKVAPEAAENKGPVA